MSWQGRCRYRHFRDEDMSLDGYVQEPQRVFQEFVGVRPAS